MVIVAIGFLIGNYFGLKKFKITTYEVASEKIPDAMDGYNIALLTDLHNYVYGKDNEELVEAIRKQSPDAIMIAGDMIVKGNHCEYEVAYQLIEQLAKEYPIYYANGNHEYGYMYTTDDELGAQRFYEYKEKLQQLGVQYLVNDHATIKKGNSQIKVYGLDLSYAYYKKFQTYKAPEGELEQLLGKSDENQYTILLAHNPIYMKDYEKWGADLVCSGHVHGGIMRLPIFGGVMSTQGTLFPKYDAGMFEEGKSTLILSSGLGTHTIHIRIWNRAEVVMIKLRQKK